MPDEPDPEDAKLVTLARSSRSRTGAEQGAAVRDDTGRTYTAATVNLPSLQLSALRAAVVLAASSGARSLEAAAVVLAQAGSVDLSPQDLAAVRDLGGPGTTVLVAGPDGAVARTVRA
jgi:hypothetical protein